MKKIYSLALVLLGLLTVAGIAVSCEFSPHEDPEHPIYVSYTITAGSVSFEGPDQLLLDIEAWIQANSIIYDTEVNYSTGEASEFATPDADAIKRYDEIFVPKFKAHLTEVAAQLAKGTYGKVSQVKATFFVSASRLQGKGRELKYEHIEFVYPTTSQN